MCFSWSEIFPPQTHSGQTRSLSFVWTIQMMVTSCAASSWPCCRRTAVGSGKRGLTWRPLALPFMRWGRCNTVLEDGFGELHVVPLAPLKSELLTYRTLRLLMIKTTRGRTFSATMALKRGAVLTSTWGRCPSASDCRRETTCWCPPPSSRTTRLISWSGSSPRTKLEPCMSMQILFSVIRQIWKQIQPNMKVLSLFTHIYSCLSKLICCYFFYVYKRRKFERIFMQLFSCWCSSKNTNAPFKYYESSLYDS